MPLKTSFLRRPRLVLVFASVLLLAGGLIWWLTRGDSDTGAAYTIATATKGSLEETVTAQGTLEPNQYVNVGAQVSGQLQKLHVDVGDAVTSGQLIAEIDPRVYESRLEEAEAQVKSLQAQYTEQKAQLELARQQHGRNAQLVEAQAISKDAFDTSAAALKAAEARLASLAAQIEQSKSTLGEAKTNLGYTKIYAPMAGTVISQTTREGQTINANQTAPTVVEVANLATMTVRAQVAEADIGKVQAGMPLYFTTLGGDTKWRTTVRQVIPSPEVVNDVVLYNVLADISNTEGRLMSGMSTQMNFVVGDAKDAVIIPTSALGKKLGEAKEGQGTPYQIFVPQGEAMVSKTIHIGLVNRSMAQVISGLKEGERIAVPTSMAGNDSSSSGGRNRVMGPRI